MKIDYETDLVEVTFYIYYIFYILYFYIYLCPLLYGPLLDPLKDTMH